MWWTDTSRLVLVNEPPIWMICLTHASRMARAWLMGVVSRKKQLLPVVLRIVGGMRCMSIFQALADLEAKQ